MCAARFLVFFHRLPALPCTFVSPAVVDILTYPADLPTRGGWTVPRAAWRRSCQGSVAEISSEPPFCTWAWAVPGLWWLHLENRSAETELDPAVRGSRRGRLGISFSTVSPDFHPVTLAILYVTLKLLGVTLDESQEAGYCQYRQLRLFSDLIVHRGIVGTRTFVIFSARFGCGAPANWGEESAAGGPEDWPIVRRATRTAPRIDGAIRNKISSGNIILPGFEEPVVREPCKPYSRGRTPASERREQDLSGVHSGRGLLCVAPFAWDCAASTFRLSAASASCGLPAGPGGGGRVPVAHKRAARANYCRLIDLVAAPLSADYHSLLPHV
uniref:Uncharacterized protein n=1 Tax=Sphaerodactylus townsendi TaxID=933632 RepID=A0ACB8FJQ2_9SAUR